MESAAAIAHADDARIQERVRELAKAHSQSELARRTGTPVSSVNRYLGESRVPADFCAALVHGMGVNPAWLLTGEGTMYLSDVTAGTADLAGGMLELVNSLNAVSRMRLGSLTGKHHLRVLRELNEALQTYNTLRDRLNARSGPILSQLLDDMKHASEKHQLDVSVDLRNAAAQIAQFCHDQELLRRFVAADSNLEFMLGHAAHALELSRDAFARTLTRTDKPHENALVQAHNLAASLCQNYRFQEARRVCRLGLALAGDDLPGLGAFHELRTLYGVICVELGDLATGAAELVTAWSRTTPLYRRGAQGMIMRGLLLSGMMTFAEAEAWAPDDIGRNRQLFRYALWSEDAASLARVLEKCAGDAPNLVRPNILEAVAARLLHARLTGKKPTRQEAARQLEESTTHPIPAPVAAFLRATFLALLGLKGCEADAIAAGELLNRLDPSVLPDFLSLALHYRNVLRTVPAQGKGEAGELRIRAKEWMEQHRSRGYSFLPGALEK